MPHDLADYTPRGPHAVGVTTLAIPDPEREGRVLETDIWYPARERTPTPDAATADHPFGRPHAALPDAPPGDGPFPALVFSHGNSGLRRQSTFLTTHLASWGFVVVAPDHVGNTFFEMLQIRDDETRNHVHLDARGNRPRDLVAALDAVLQADGRWPTVDPLRVGALGHSFGGWTAFKMPRRDARVRAVCGLAPASEPFVGRKAFDPEELPFDRSLPLLVVAGRDDVLVDLDTSVHPLFARTRAPHALVAVDGCDHFHFCDGVELLHTMHERNPRERQPRPTRPYAELLPEERVHRILRTLVTGFFADALGERGDADPAPSPSRLAQLDPSLERLTPRAVESA